MSTTMTHGLRSRLAREHEERVREAHQAACEAVSRATRALVSSDLAQHRGEPLDAMALRAALDDARDALIAAELALHAAVHRGGAQ